MKRTILVTGATGSISSNLIPQLVKGGAGVRAVVRDAKKGEALKKQGCDVVVHDLDKSEGIENLFKGVDAAFLLTAPNPNASKQMSNLIQGAKKSGNKPHIVRLSALKAAPDAPTENGRLHHKSDQELIDSGLTYTILRPQFFFQNALWGLDAIKNEGKLYQGMGDAKIGMIDVRDVADCAANVLLKGGHEGKIYTPTGPVSVSWHDVAKELSQVAGKNVEYVPVPLDAVRESVKGMTGSDWMAQLMVDYSKAYSEGWGDFTTNDVQTLAGHKPRGPKEFASEVVAPMTGLQSVAGR